jgi:hypothetical protein
VVVVVKERSSGWAVALIGSGVEDESRLTVDTLKSVGVPSSGVHAANAGSTGVDVVQSRRADTLPLESVIDVVGLASITCVGSGVPPGGRSATAVSRSIESGDVRRAYTAL